MISKQNSQEKASQVVGCGSQYLSVMKFFDLIKIQQEHYADFTYVGNSSFSFVLQATNKKTDQIVALIITECDDRDINGMNQVQEDYRLLRQNSNCKYIVQDYNCFFLVEVESDEVSNKKEAKDQGKQINKQKNEKKVFFVVEQELCQTNLKNYFSECKSKNSYPSQQKEKIAIQMLDSLAYLPKFNLLHRDIKPSNFLLPFDQNQSLTVKICDLSFASTLQNYKSRITDSKIIGTQAYFAPEVEKCIYEKFDIFSLRLVFPDLIEKFNFDETTNEDKLEIKSNKIYSNYDINRNSNIYKKVQQCVNYQVENSKFARELPSQFKKENENDLNIDNSSVIEKSQLKQISEQEIFSQIQKAITEQKQKKQSEIEPSPVIEKISEMLSQIQKAINKNKNRIKNEIQQLSKSCKNENHLNKFKSMYDLKQKPFNDQEYENILKLLYNNPNYNNNFEFISVGAKGLVLGAFNKNLGTKTVLKIRQVQSKHEVVQEVGIMRDCQMPLVIKFYGYFYLSVNKNDDFVVYEIEKCSGNLKQYFKRLQKEKIQLNNEQKIQIAVQIIDVVNYLNYNDIVHRDIKLENFLYIKNELDVPTIKLANFDQSRKIPYNLYWLNVLIKQQYPVQGICGTIGYIAPEYLDKTMYTYECEIFSVGICLALIDDFEKLEPLLQKKAQYYKSEFKTPFEYFHVQEEVKTEKAKFMIFFYKLLNKKLNSDHVRGIGSEIAKYNSISNLKINLDYNEIGTDGAKAIALEIAKYTNLSSLSLWLVSNNIGPDGAKEIASNISKIPTLSTLSLWLGQNNIGIDGAKAVASLIAKCHTLSTLSLNLSGSNIGVDGSNSVISEITKCRTISALRIDLENNNIGKDGAKSIGKQIAQCPTLSSLSIWLGNNNIGSDGAIAFAQEIAKCPNLSTLILCDSKIDQDGAKGLASEIAKCPNLSTLSICLNNNNIGSNGARAVAYEISKIPTLSTLILFMCKDIGQEGAIAIPSEIAKIPTLTTLNLWLCNNKIGQDGVKALASEIAKCPTLSTLRINIQSNEIGSNGAKAFASEIAKCPTISKLYINFGSNNIDSDGAKSVASELAKCPTLFNLTLSFNDNQIDSNGAKELASEIAQCPNITILSLILSMNNIESDGAKLLALEIAKCSKIFNLYIDLRKNKINEEIQFSNLLPKVSQLRVDYKD